VLRRSAPALGLLLLLAFAAWGERVERPVSDVTEEVVLLLHGLARSDRAMEPLAEQLGSEGFTVYNLSYPSTKLPPEALGTYLHERVLACCETASRLHFVTHSLGGILVRAYLAVHDTPNLGRVVMLAPPNHGSELVDLLGDSEAFRWSLGPTATQLGTDTESFPNRLPLPNFELGVIAGTESINPVGSIVIPGENDGTVSVRSTKLEGMSDFIAVPASHTLIMRSEAAGRQTVEFLRYGRFEHPEASAGRLED
jgi:triacylglycerol lipase